MKTLLICHEGALLDREGLARWLASFSDLVGLVVLREKWQRRLQRVRYEITRVGPVRFLDVVALRLYYKLFVARGDQRWEQQTLAVLGKRYPPLDGTPVLVTPSPNSAEAEAFMRRLAPDIVLARCKVILTRRIFSLARVGTLVMHPGVCPEYRNAHGCFWALARGDVEKVGMTLLKVDEGIDTGPIYGFYTYPYDSVGESHVVIQHRVVFENLKALEEKFKDIVEGRGQAIDVRGRASRVWGQPWLTRYLAWKRRARRDGR